VTGTLDVDVGFALPAGVLPVSVDKVHVKVTIKPRVGTKLFEAGLVLVGRATGMNYDVSTGQVLVTVGGPLADLDRLDPAAFTVNLDVGGLGPGAHDLEPVPLLQAGLRLLSVDPAKVTVTVTPVASAAPPTAGPSGP
jgi:hypothetical protein